MDKKKRITIVGDGNVGSSIALTLLLRNIGDELVLVDPNAGKTKADSLDMEHARYLIGSRTIIRQGDKKDYRDSDFIIVTAAGKAGPTSNDRLLLLGQTKKILTGILSDIKESGFGGFLIIVSNPVDIMTYYAYRMTWLKRNHVIGSGTLLDTARLNTIVAEEKGFEASEISDLYMLGEHGLSAAGIYSNASVSGSSLSLTSEEKNDFVSKTSTVGWEIICGKGNTSYGIAASVYRIIKAILMDENTALPVSIVNEEETVSYSRLCLLNHNGIGSVLPLQMNPEESEKFRHSVESLKAICSTLMDE